MPGYIKKLRQIYNHETSKKPQHRPYCAQPKIYGAATQDAIPRDDSDKLNDDNKNKYNKSSGDSFTTEGQWTSQYCPPSVPFLVNKLALPKIGRKMRTAIGLLSDTQQRQDTILRI